MSFLKNLLGLPSEREIELCIDVVPSTNPISMPLYRMTPAELKSAEWAVEVVAWSRFY